MLKNLIILGFRKLFKIYFLINIKGVKEEEMNPVYYLIGIAVIVVLGLLFLIRFRHFKQKVFVIFIVAVVLFFFITSQTLLKGVNLKTTAGIEQAFRIYIVWFGQAFSNIKTITSNVIHMDWSKPVEIANSSISSVQNLK